MKQIRLADLARFADVKPHTFRTWEQRYNFCKSKRTPTNFRYYSVEDVDELLKVCMLTKIGYRISHINQLSKTEKETILYNIGEDRHRKLVSVFQLITCMLAGDIICFDECLDEAVLTWGIEETIETIILPFIHRTNLLSYHDSSNETHFAVTSIRRKIILGIELAKPKFRVAKTAIFFLPIEEHFDLILLYFNYVAKKIGYRTLYLGTNVANDNLRKVLLEHEIHILVTFLTSLHDLDIPALGSYLQKSNPEVSIILSGYLKVKFFDDLTNNIKYVDYRYIADYLKEGLT